jgi:hypothetical protein
LIIAGDILCKVQDLKSQGSANEQTATISQGSANEQNGDNSQVSADEQSLKFGTSEQDIKNCEIPAGMHIKMLRSKKATASIGSVSSILGTSYTRPSHSVKENFEKAKPLKIEVEKSVIDALDMESSSSGFQGPKKESLSNREIEQFLFAMLGEGFKLSMDVIREVLGTTSTCNPHLLRSICIVDTNSLLYNFDLQVAVDMTSIRYFIFIFFPFLYACSTVFSIFLIFSLYFCSN